MFLSLKNHDHTVNLDSVDNFSFQGNILSISYGNEGNPLYFEYKGEFGARDAYLNIMSFLVNGSNKKDLPTPSP